MLLVGSVLNNTPVVAMLIPIVKSWARRCGFDVGRFMIPLSYASMLSGSTAEAKPSKTCTERFLTGATKNIVLPHSGTRPRP